MTQLSRRSLVGAAAVMAGAGAAAGVGGAYAVQRTASSPPRPAVIPFRGSRQAGIITPAQDRLHFVSLDVTTRERSQLIRMLKDWTAAAERMTRGEEPAPGGVVGGGPFRAPADTGEAYDLDAARLTLTIGFGRRFARVERELQRLG